MLVGRKSMKPAVEPTIPEGDPALCPRPAPPERTYTDVFDFLTAHGVNLAETRPQVRSFKSAEEAIKYILKAAVIEVEKGD
jgi:hypothetical protein